MDRMSAPAKSPDTATVPAAIGSANPNTRAETPATVTVRTARTKERRRATRPSANSRRATATTVVRYAGAGGRRNGVMTEAPTIHPMAERRREPGDRGLIGRLPGGFSAELPACAGRGFETPPRGRRPERT